MIAGLIYSVLFADGLEKKAPHPCSRIPHLLSWSSLSRERISRTTQPMRTRSYDTQRHEGSLLVLARTFVSVISECQTRMS